jgi:hypothetical protein
MSALTKLTLLGLTIVGAAGIHGLSISTGFYDLIESYKAKGVLHDGTIYDRKITGADGVDDFLGTLVQFFWPCADGSSPGVSLQSALFQSQFIPWIILSIVEGNRRGMKGKVAS